MLEEIWRCSLSSFSFVCVFSLLCWTRGNLRYRTFDWLQDSDRIFSKFWPVCRQEGRVSRQVYLFHPAKGGKVIVFLFSLETFPEEEDEEEEEPSGHIWTLPPYFYLTSPGSVLVLFYFYILVLCLSCGPPPTTSLAVSTFFILFLTPPSNERAICLVPFVAFRFFFCEDNFIKKKKKNLGRSTLTFLKSQKSFCF